MNMIKHNLIRLLGITSAVFAFITLILALPFLFFICVAFQCLNYPGYYDFAVFPKQKGQPREKEKRKGINVVSRILTILVEFIR
ncbi:hypothetical protein LCGC14_1078170 [marine sediment metagenome]|uniref:Bacterial sugar transferase domain-containing protein n=1 Tax=marine sediment metagenome TaxID=412755 RepID=A0A0F9N3N1_9ZZZZ